MTEFIQPDMTKLVCVTKTRNDGSRGHHLIARERYDANPAAFELWDAPMEPAKAAAPVAPLPLPQGTDDRQALRAEYLSAIGKRPFPGWDADTLRQKIAAHHPSGD